MKLKVGDTVKVRHIGDQNWVVGRVELVSQDGKALGLTIDGPVRAGWGILAGGALPLYYLPDRDMYLGLTEDSQYELERLLVN
jgi:hypothetical protein